jgi:hypothetical protein
MRESKSYGFVRPLVSGHKATIDIYGTNMDESALPPGATGVDDLEYDEDDEHPGGVVPQSSGPP